MSLSIIGINRQSLAEPVGSPPDAVDREPKFDDSDYLLSPTDLLDAVTWLAEAQRSIGDQLALIELAFWQLDLASFFDAS